MQKTIFRAPAALMAAGAFVYCLLNSGRVAESCGIYLKLCGEKLIPALFVFSVLSSVICGSKAFYRLCAFFPFWGVETALLILGVLGGFPLGASVAEKLYAEGQVNKKQAEYLCAFTNNPSLSFTVSYVGAVLGSKKTGAVLAILTVLSAVVSAVLLRYVFLPKEDRHIAPSLGLVKSKGLAEAVRDGCFNMLIICGCVVFFGSIGVLLPEKLRGILELSGGIANCKTETQAAFLLGFSSFSVMCQVSAVCGGKLSVLPFLLSKLIQSAFMTFFAYFLFDFRF